MLNIEELIPILTKGLVSGSKEIGEILREKGESSEAEEEYRELEIEYMIEQLALKGVIALDIVERNPIDYYWLGNRRRFISDFADKVKKGLNEKRNWQEIVCKALEEYNKDKIGWTRKKLDLLEKSKVLYHGSTQIIPEFEPRIGSAGDRKELVYLSRDRDFSACFAMNNQGLHKEICASPKTKVRHINFRGHTLKSLILIHDVGGWIHCVEREEELRKFGVAHSKDYDEFCSTQGVSTTIAEPIISVLNDLILNKKMKVFCRERSVHDIPDDAESDITPEILLETRQNIIDEIRRERLPNDSVLERLENQQCEAIKILESRKDKTYVDRELLHSTQAKFSDHKKAVDIIL